MSDIATNDRELFLVEGSVLLTWGYFTIYFIFFFITSIWSAIQVKDEYKIIKTRSQRIRSIIRKHPAGITHGSVPATDSKLEPGAAPHQFIRI